MNVQTPPNAQTPPLLQIDGLGISIGGARILDGVCLELRAGEILGLVGASGSGKSMTALAITQLLPRNAHLRGSIRLRGDALTAKSEAELCRIRGRDIGIVFQEPMTALNPLMRIGDQVTETVRLHSGASETDAVRMTRTAFTRVGLGDDPDSLQRYPHELSGGGRQRVAIAMAVVLEPALLIADEPTTALDVTTQAQVLALLEDLVRTTGMGLILITHDMAVIGATTTQVAVMHNGKIVERGATAQILREPRDPYAKELLAAAYLAPKQRSSKPDPSRAISAPAILEAREIVREYPRRRRSLWSAPPPLRAVDGVSLKIHPGETVGLIGETGSGKSSLLRVMLALDRPRSGEVHLLGEVFTAARGAALRRLRRSIQAVFQDPYASFDPQWSVERVVAEPFHLLDAGLSHAERRHKVALALERVGLSAADARRYPREFSGGQRQRIAIARALITEPAVIAFDEAVSALDVLVRAQILRLLAELNASSSLSILFVSHDLSVVRSIADRVYVMHRGRIVEEGYTEAVFASPREAYTSALIAATPSMA
jgi:peptide/nickel transport system ATP-binding protein